jgi:hypothetical protein
VNARSERLARGDALGEMKESAKPETLIGRKDELRELREAIQKGESRVVWGPMDVGKTAVIKAAISELPDAEKGRCIYWSGSASGKQLLSYLVGKLYEAGALFARKRIHADGVTSASLSRWLQKQTSLRLRGILYTALLQGHYRIFLDDFPPANHNMAHLLKEIMYRCRTPIYLAARDCSQKGIGHAWSLYWNDGLRLQLNPLPERMARKLLDVCIEQFALGIPEPNEFREDVLRLSGNIPGSIVRMCELAIAAKYRSGDRIKITLVHADYLMRSNSSAFHHIPTFLQ